jgi:hypothetical protein
MSADINVEIHPILTTHILERTQRYAGQPLDSRTVLSLESELAGCVAAHLYRGLPFFVVTVEDT